MKKQKRDYSLTAKERKAKRYGTSNKNKNKKEQKEATINAELSPRESAESGMISSQKRAKVSALIIAAVVFVAIVLLIVALVTPVALYTVNPYRGNGKVMAKFNLSNGMKLEFVIDESDYDTAATNFIFLAKNGFFDNTVFYDAQNGWLRFGGYDAQPASNSSSSYESSHHKKDNTDYCRAFSALPNNRFDKLTNKFGYRLRPDSNGTSDRLLEKEGVLAFLYSDTATEFQFSYTSQATNQIVSLNTDGTKKTYDLAPTMVGHAYNAKTITNLKLIAESSKLNTSIASGYLWSPPTPDVKISSVKIYNLDGKKWDKFDFIAYMKSNNSNGERRLSQWIGQV